jgi:hypothetical protein
VVQLILDRLNQLKHTIGDAGLDLINASVHAFVNSTNTPASSINAFKCTRENHPQFPGAVACYGTTCSICKAEDSLSYRHVYLPCGRWPVTRTRDMLTTTGYPFCMPYISRWFKEKGQRVCLMCRSHVPEEQAHFKRDSTYALGWPRNFW